MGHNAVICSALPLWESVAAFRWAAVTPAQPQCAAGHGRRRRGDVRVRRAHGQGPESLAAVHGSTLMSQVGRWNLPHYPAVRRAPRGRRCGAAGF